MNELTTPEPTLIDSTNIDKTGKSIGSYIISSVMDRYTLQDHWTVKNEKVTRKAT